MPDNELKILVRYHADIPKIGKIDVGDWIDLYAAEDKHLDKGEWKLISLGVSMKLPAGYEAHVVPRSPPRTGRRARPHRCWGFPRREGQGGASRRSGAAAPERNGSGGRVARCPVAEARRPERGQLLAGSSCT